MDKGQSLRAHICEQVGEGTFDAELGNVLLDLTMPAKAISCEVNKAGLVDILGLTGQQNVHGEDVKKLDVYADELIVKTMRDTGAVCGMASEENEEVIPPSREGRESRYLLFFDPLDGSSNIDVNVSIGTIFAVYSRRSANGAATPDDFLQPGFNQVMAGYFAYGSSTMLIYTAGAGVHGFTLDIARGEFLMSHPGITTPARGKTFSCNEGNSTKWEESTRRYVSSLKKKDGAGRPYSGRYVGSFVSDFHRNLLKGGIFLYPGQHEDPGKPYKGKLRLMYESNPMALIVEQAGGLATDGEQPILEIRPTDIHHRTALIIGSREDVEEYLSYRSGSGS